jgi:hypothetical protein
MKAATLCSLLSVVFLGAGVPVLPAASAAEESFAAELSADGRDLRVRVGEDEVLHLVDGNLIRFRCAPGTEQWVGLPQAYITLDWNQDYFAVWRPAAVVVEEAGERLRISIDSEKPDSPGSRIRTSIVGERTLAGTVTYTFRSELSLDASAAAPSSLCFMEAYIDRIFWPEAFLGSGELYQEYVYGSPGDLRRAPKLHIFTEVDRPPATFETLGQSFDPGSLFAVVDAEEGGIVFRTQEASGPTNVGVCWWSWEPWFWIRNVGHQREFSYTMTVEAIDQGRGRELLAAAEPVAFREDPDYQVPVFTLEGVNDFRQRLERAGQWAWEPTGEGARLDEAVGYDDHASATLRSEGEGYSAWSTRALWSNPWGQVAISGWYRVSAMVRTQALKGQARLGVVQYHGPEVRFGREPSPSYAYSRAISKNTEWQKISVYVWLTAPKLKVFLEQSGRGQTWFDDVRIVPLCDPRPGQRARPAFHTRENLPYPTWPFAIETLAGSQPGVVWMGAVNLVWQGSWVRTPAVSLTPGRYKVVVHARGEGCPQDKSMVLVEGPPGLAELVTIEPGRTDDYTVELTLTRAQDVSILLTSVADGTCDGATGPVDKNVVVKAVTLAGPFD